MKKGTIEDKVVDVLSLDEWHKTGYKYDPEFTAIEYQDTLYPVRTTDPRITHKPGYYNNGLFGRFVDPNKDEEDKYKINDNVVDLEDTKNMKDLIEKTDKLKKLEGAILTDPDNIFTPKVYDEDEALMKGMKQAIIAKHIDIDKYKGRFTQFTNDRRLFNGHSITYKKAVEWIEGLDLKGTLILEDRESDVPNPMNKKIVVKINDNKGAEADGK